MALEDDIVDERFPEDISYGSQGGSEFHTQVVSVKSGYEYRNQLWSTSRRRYQAAYGVKTYAQLEVLLTYFEVAKGRLRPFPYKDPVDYKSCPISDTIAFDDQVLLTATGGETEIQLIKTYSTGGKTAVRNIVLPDDFNELVLVGKNSVELDEESEYNLDFYTGLITWDFPLTVGDVITAGFEFLVPCRFDTDHLSMSVDDYNIGAADVPIIEVKA